MRSRNRRHDIPLLNKYTSSDTALAILQSQSLRWSSPELFNDPFDVPREWEGFTFEDFEEAYVERFL